MWVWSAVGVARTTFFMWPPVQGTFHDSGYDHVAAELRK